MDKLRIIVGGNIGLYPTGGATWDYIQYPLGLKMLGHDVYYIEDTRQYPIFQKDKRAWDDATECIVYLEKVMSAFGFKDRWAYRDIASGKSYGMSEDKIRKLCSSADLFINISCSTFLRDEYLKIPSRILIDSDPMFTQIQYAKELAGEEEAKYWNTKMMIENHNYLFTFGENISSEDCKIPTFDFKWHTTRQPICLNEWENNITIKKGPLTSIMNWSGRNKIIYGNNQWGQKDVEFEKYKTIPHQMPENQFEIVINKPLNSESIYNPEVLQSLGWKLLSPDDAVANTEDYRKYIINSCAEFSIAKETYVKSNSGWFSCRSACYLAAGRPVITEETGWSKYIPSGSGLFAFDSEKKAVEAINTINSDLKKHSAAAKEVAKEYFDSNVVLTNMLNKLI